MRFCTNDCYARCRLRYVYAVTSSPRITYVVIAHAREQQLLRLVRVLRHECPNSSVVIHWDSQAPPLDPAPFLELGSVFMVGNPVHPEWGGFEMVTALSRSMRTALDLTSFDWLVLLSGQDYPIMPLERVQQELAASGVDAFVDAHRVASGRWAFRWRRSADTRLGRRYYFAYVAVPAIGKWLPRCLRGAILRAAFLVDECQPFASLWPMPAGVRWRLGVRRLRAPFCPSRPCRVGSQWFNLSRRGVERILDHAGEHSAIARHYRRTIIADESLFQTVICADPELAVRLDNARYQIWADTESPLHPDTLTIDRLDEILTCGKHFARKFDDQIDSEVLDRIDEHRRSAAAVDAGAGERRRA